MADSKIYKITLTAVYNGSDDVDLNAAADSVFKSMRDADPRLMMLRVDTIKEQKSIPKAMQADIDRIVEETRKKLGK